MWMVARGRRGLEPERRELPEAVSETLRIWYTGQGTRADEEIAVKLVQEARKRDQWLACDCLGDKVAPPLMSPALLTEADTYYLRRLTGQGRPEHRLDCPYFRDQALAETQLGRESPRNPPDGLFAVLKPRPVNLSQKPEAEPPAARTRALGHPRLAKLLWLLLALGRRNVLPVLGDEVERSIAVEFAAIRHVASAIDIAPGIKLNELLFTHARDWQSRRAFAMLRRRALEWPDNHEPQAFMLLFGRSVHGSIVETADGPVDLGHRIEHAGTSKKRVPGPELVIAAIGKHPDDGSLRALRTWSQPIYSGHRFIPVENDQEREFVHALADARRTLGKLDIYVSAEKPLFDFMTPRGELRPHWIVEVRRENLGPVTGIVELPGRRLMTDGMFEGLSFLGPVFALDRGCFDTLPVVLTDLARSGS